MSLTKPIPKKKYKCKICDSYFEVEGQKRNGFFVPNVSPWNIKTCSEDCRKENNRLNSEKHNEVRKNIPVLRKCRFCGDDVFSSKWCPQSFCGGKTGECYKKWLSESRKGSNNPAYRNGFAISGKRTYTGIHLRACSKYRRAFMEKHGYAFCEVCGVNSNGTPKFEVHHIYYASLYPKHESLHDFKNLIHICISCHNNFHASKLQDKFEELENERGLKELFSQKKV